MTARPKVKAPNTSDTPSGADQAAHWATGQRIGAGGRGSAAAESEVVDLGEVQIRQLGFYSAAATLAHWLQLLFPVEVLVHAEE